MAVLRDWLAAASPLMLLPCCLCTGLLLWLLSATPIKASPLDPLAVLASTAMAVAALALAGLVAGAVSGSDAHSGGAPDGAGCGSAAAGAMRAMHASIARCSGVGGTAAGDATLLAGMPAGVVLLLVAVVPTLWLVLGGGRGAATGSCGWGTGTLAATVLSCVSGALLVHGSATDLLLLLLRWW